MRNFFVIPISLAVLICSIYLWRRAAGTLSIVRLNMISWPFFLLYTITWLVIPIAAGFDVGHLTRYTYASISNKDTALAVWFAVMWMYLAMPGSALLVQKLQGSGTSMLALLQTHAEKPLLMAPGRLSAQRSYIPYVLITICFFAFQIYLIGRKGWSDIPLLNVWQTGDVVGTQYLRSSVFREESWLFRVLGVVFGNINWWSYVLYLISRVKGAQKWWSLFWIAFIWCILTSIINTTMTGLVIYLATLTIIRGFIPSKRVTLARVTNLALLMIPFVMLPFLFMIFKGSEGGFLDVLNRNVFARVFWGQLGGTYFAYEIFPRIHDFLYFSSTGKIIHDLLGLGSNPSYGVVQMFYYNPSGVVAGTAGHMTSNYLSEAWANFGWIGWFIAPLWVGALIQIVNRWFLNRQKSVFLLSTYAYLATVFGYASDFVGFYYPLGTALALIGMYLIAKVMRLV